MAQAKTGNDLIEAELRAHNEKLSEHFRSDSIIVKSPIRFGLDDLIKSEIEELHSSSATRPTNLTVLLETTGGYIEVVERIYNVFRRFYDHVNFIVPNYAYSAGTVLVLSGDEIFLDYYSVLGPIDPQMESENDRFVSGIGYLAKFEQLTKEINAASSPDTVRAQLAYLLRKFDPAELFDLEQARDHSEDLLEEWLSKHKFKHWQVRETSGTQVTDQDRRDRAKEIAHILGNPERWHSHGRGIGIRELTGDEVKLKINDFGLDRDLNGKIKVYYDLFLDYCKRLGISGPGHVVLHCASGLKRGT